MTTQTMAKASMIALGLFCSTGRLTASGLAADQTWSGTISDTMCKATHTMKDRKKNMSDRQCALACTTHGAQYVLVSDGQVFKLTNHDADLKTHAGHVVKLTGELKDETIKVSRIVMPKGADTR